MNRESISFWQKDLELPRFAALSENQQVDVCIVGAGISGLTSGYCLSASGKSVIILDDGPIAGGQTIRTTGHLATALDDRYFMLEKYFGLDGARLAAQSHGAAIDFIEDLVKKHHINCEFDRLDAYLFESPLRKKNTLEQEFQACRRAGLDGIKWVERAPLQSFDTGSAICFPNQGQFSPLPYLKKLCDLIHQQNGRIFSDTRAAKINKKIHGFEIITDQNRKVQAKHLILAGNALSDNRLFPHTKQAPYRTYVIAAAVPKGSVHKALYYDTEDPYHYVRIAKWNDQFDMLISGGGDHRTAEETHIEAIYQKIEAWTLKRFPMMQEIMYRWSGQVVEPVDGLAFIGRSHPKSEKYFITGDSGNGLTHGTLGAILIHDLIVEKKNAWEKLYSPHRVTFKAAGDFVAENANAFSQYKDWATDGDIRSSYHLKPNQGAIVRKGLKKLACYKDEKGTLHKMSAVCPHLGALVRWNDSEHCWECPAHGSRFSGEGTLLQGPANADLKK